MHVFLVPVIRRSRELPASIFVRRSRFSDVIRVGGGGEKVLKIMLFIKYRLIREALVILDSLTNHVL